MFLCAKSASAATAALGFAGYVLAAFGVSHEVWRIGLGLAAVVVLTLVILGGMRQSNRTNTIVVSITLAALVVFVLAGIRPLLQNGALHFTPFWGLPGEEGSPLRGLLHASALMFVAYTGYGRIATLGEEVRSPRTTIPRAIIVTLIASMILYVSVAVVAVGVAGAGQFAEQTQATSAAEVIAAALACRAPAILAAGAITAMLGVLLNLLLGLSRAVLAMGRRRTCLQLWRASETSKTPEAAVIVVAVLIAALVLIGDVRITWSFSALPCWSTPSPTWPRCRCRRSSGSSAALPWRVCLPVFLAFGWSLASDQRLSDPGCGLRVMLADAPAVGRIQEKTAVSFEFAPVVC